MVEDMEAEQTKSPKQTSNADYLEVTEEANVNEAVTAEAKSINNMEIDTKEERNTQAYK